MALTAANPVFLNVPMAPSSRRFMRTPDDVDDSFNVDLETSFTSNVSLNSPPRDSMMVITPDYEGVEPMDVSPCPAPRPMLTSKSKFNRPRAFTSSGRLFGRDVSNEDVSQPEPPAPKPPLMASKRIQRSNMPANWNLQFNSTLQVHKFPGAPFIAEPVSPISDDAMDVDSPLQPAAVIHPTFSSFGPPPSNVPDSATFNNLFYDSNSPQKPTANGQTPNKKQRRSLSPDTTRKSIDLESSFDLSVELPSSPSERKLHRMPSGPLLSMGGSKPSLQSLGLPSGMQRGRRHALLSMHPDVRKAVAPEMDNEAHPSRPGVTRRAFSARLPPAALSGGEALPTDPDVSSSFDLPDGSSPAQAYAQRQQAKAKTLRRCDNFKAATVPQGLNVGMNVTESPSTSRFLKAGMPGFGDNESYGKLLPCHRVSEDGLMRIVPETLDMLLDGKYDSQIAEYFVIDCRFDYEYNGGHVPGAINVRSTDGLEELLLGANASKPVPSVSGDKAKKTILVFHCEFSAKRAPTFAKHLRSKDRATNNHVYPKIYYPEVYILEGGYSRYFRASGARCQPPAYVPMDDPQHKVSAKTGMELFERKTKFGRTKSYAYGDQVSSRSLSSRATELHQQKQMPAPATNSLFAAAAINPKRPSGKSLLSPKDAIAPSDDEDETDIGDSPCPQPNRPGAFKPRKLSTVRQLMRSETYDPSRMAY